MACIRGDEARHIEKVLRLGPGDSLELFDADGSVYQAVIESLHREEVFVRILARLSGAVDMDAQIVLCQAVVKSQKMDAIIEKCTELGATGFRPFFAHRSIPRWDAGKAAARVQHWNNIARAAVKQSGARRLPTVEPLLSFSEMLTRQFPDCERAMLWENERKQPFRGLLAGCGRKIVLMVGPEGGFTPDEADEAAQHGFQVCGLGERILRAETAAIVAVGCAAYEFGMVGG